MTRQAGRSDAHQQDASWLTLAISVARHFFWMAGAAARITFRILWAVLWMALGFWTGYRVVRRP